MYRVPYLHIHPSKIVSRVVSEGIPGRSGSKGRFDLQTVKNVHDGFLSTHAKKRLIHLINWMIFLTPRKRIYLQNSTRHLYFSIGFVTLTLPASQVHSDQDLKARAFNQFLVEARNRWHVRKYVWRIEPQANGNLHFHILWDAFVHWQILRDTWNRIINKLGYVDRYRDEMVKFHFDGFCPRADLLEHWPLKSQQAAYKSGVESGWTSPNSTDVHRVKKIRKAGAYFSKYYTKTAPDQLENYRDDGEAFDLNPPTDSAMDEWRKKYPELPRPIGGKLWGSSENLTKFSQAVDVNDGLIRDEFEALADQHPRSFHRFDYCDVLYFDLKEIRRKASSRLYRALTDHVESVQDSAKQLAIDAPRLTALLDQVDQPAETLSPVQGSLNL